jgi:DNA-binding transcriptional LysR family regulator
MIEEAEADLAAPEPSGLVTIAAFPTAAAAFAPVLARSVRGHPGLKLLLRQTQRNCPATRRPGRAPARLAPRPRRAALACRSGPY